MRVATNSLSDSLVSQLNSLNTRQTRLQNQAVTGQRVQWADDDPAAMRRALDLRSQGQTETQYKKNIQSLQQYATSSLDAMRGVQKLGDRAGEIATLADGTKSPIELQAYAAEVTQLIERGVQTMNSKVGDSYLFGGTLTTQAPYAITKDADGRVTGVTYQGNTAASEAEIAAGVTVSAQVPGSNADGTGPRGFIADTRNGADFFNHLIALQDHLLAGDTTTIAATDRTALADDEENMVSQLASNAALQSRLEAASTSSTARTASLRQQISTQTDADLAETLVKLNQTQTAYKAALQSGASLLQTSLMDYLR